MPDSTPQCVTVLGATGSIGISTLDVIARHPDRFKVFALTAHGQVDRLFGLCLRFSPCYAVLVDPRGASDLRQRLEAHGCATQVLAGAAALVDVATHADTDTVMAAIVGAAGLAPTLAAAVLNAANEEAVAAFLEGRIGFTHIPGIISASLERARDLSVDSVEAVLDTDARARSLARDEIFARQATQ